MTFCIWPSQNRFLQKDFVFWWKFHWCSDPRHPIDNKSNLVQVMAWCQTDDKPLPELVSTQICDITSQVHSAIIPFRGRERQTEALSYEESEQRALVRKEWTRYKLGEYLDLMRAVNGAMHSQQRALEELRAESEELYQQAIQVSLLCMFLFFFLYVGWGIGSL